MEKKNDTAIITFNAPCHGDDVSERLSLELCSEYIKTVAAYVKKQFSVQKVFSYATSFGGYQILRYIAEHGNPFHKIVLRCPAVNAYDVIYHTIMNGEEREMLQKEKNALVGFDRKIRIDQEFIEEIQEADLSKYDYKNFSNDLIIIQGTEDEVVPFEAVSAFSKKNNIRFIAVEGADHRFQDSEKMNLAIEYTFDYFFKQL